MRQYEIPDYMYIPLLDIKWVGLAKARGVNVYLPHI